MRDQQQQRSGLFDFIFGQVRDAVADMRDKLVFEGWFGRPSRDASGVGLSQQWARPTIHDGPSFEDQWAVLAPGERGGEAPGLDIDR